jgi:hypothetical protein
VAPHLGKSGPAKPQEGACAAVTAESTPPQAARVDLGDDIEAVAVPEPKQDNSHNTTAVLNRASSVESIYSTASEASIYTSPLQGSPREDLLQDAHWQELAAYSTSALVQLIFDTVDSGGNGVLSRREILYSPFDFPTFLCSRWKILDATGRTVFFTVSVDISEWNACFAELEEKIGDSFRNFVIRMLWDAGVGVGGEKQPPSTKPQSPDFVAVPKEDHLGQLSVATHGRSSLSFSGMLRYFTWIIPNEKERPARKRTRRPWPAAGRAGTFLRVPGTLPHQGARPSAESALSAVAGQLIIS